MLERPVKISEEEKKHMELVGELEKGINVFESYGVPKRIFEKHLDDYANNERIWKFLMEFSKELEGPFLHNLMSKNEHYEKLSKTNYMEILNELKTSEIWKKHESLSRKSFKTIAEIEEQEILEKQIKEYPNKKGIKLNYGNFLNEIELQKTNLNNFLKECLKQSFGTELNNYLNKSIRTISESGNS